MIMNLDINVYVCVRVFNLCIYYEIYLYKLKIGLLKIIQQDARIVYFMIKSYFKIIANI
jgi:hypothetical protein